MSEKGGQVESVESTSPTGVRRTRGQKFKRHCARRWWIYLILFIIIVLAVVLGIIFGAIPKISQDTVNKSTLNVDGIAIRDPSNSQFILDMNSTVHASPPVKSHFAPQTFEMYLPPNGTEPIVPFMDLSIGQLDIKDVFTINVTNVETNILNSDAYLAFSTLVLAAETLDLGIRSKPKLYVGSVNFHVNYQKTVQLRGLNGLKGITLTNSSILSTPGPQGQNQLTTARIPNPSSFTLEIGDLVTDLSVLGMELGYSIIRNLTLYPGDNIVQVDGYLKDEYATSPLIAASLSEPNLNVTLTANATIFNGQHISWLEGPLKAAPPVTAVLNPS